MNGSLLARAAFSVLIIALSAEWSSGAGNAIEDVWTHSGETSAIVSCMTAEPSRVRIEYGRTRELGSATTLDENPGWVHIIRLKGLEADAAYQTRILATGPDGQQIASEQLQIQPKRIEGAIRVPDELQGPPYVLDKAGATYVLTRDIVTDGAAFKITGVGARLELDGHTVRYARRLEPEGEPKDGIYDNRGYGYGVFIKPARWQGAATVVNGILEETTAKEREDGSGLGHNPLIVSGAGNIELAGLTLIYAGKDIRGMWLHNTSAPHIHHCIVDDRGIHISNRHAGLDGIGSASASNVHHNLVRRVRHRAIAGGDKAEIHHNEIHCDSWATNAYGIFFYRDKDASAHHNYIFGGGYHLIGIGTVAGCENIRVYDNHIELTGGEPLDRCAEYGDLNEQNGVRITWGGKDLEYYNNTIMITGHGRCRLRGTWFYSDDRTEGVVFRNNTVSVLGQRESPAVVGGATGTVARVQPEPAAMNSKAAWYMPRTQEAWAVAACGDPGKRQIPIVHRNNTFISNVCNVKLGEVYGIGSNHVFIANRFVREGTDERYTTIRIGCWNKPCIGHVFQDSTFEGGAGYEKIRFENDGPRELSVKWTLTLTVRDEAGRAIEQAEVSITDKDGKVVFSDKTDAEGQVRAVLTEYVLFAEALTDPAKDENVDPEKKSMPVRVLRTPHTATVRAMGFSPSTNTVKVDRTKSLTVTLKRG